VNKTKFSEQNFKQNYKENKNATILNSNDVVIKESLKNENLEKAR
jgi:hypothetical protein